MKSVDAWHKKAEKAAIDYSFHMNLTKLDDAIAAEIPSLCEMGITTLKTFTAYNNRLRLSDGDIFRALRIAKDNGMLVMAPLRKRRCDRNPDYRSPEHWSPDSRMARQNPSGLGRGRSDLAGLCPGSPGGRAAVRRPHERRRRSGHAAAMPANMACG